MGDPCEKQIFEKVLESSETKKVKVESISVILTKKEQNERKKMSQEKGTG